MHTHVVECGSLCLKSFVFRIDYKFDLIDIFCKRIAACCSNLVLLDRITYWANKATVYRQVKHASQFVHQNL